eukprot:PhF_6_TR42676/c0_g1_i1/m.64345
MASEVNSRLQELDDKMKGLAHGVRQNSMDLEAFRREILSEQLKMHRDYQDLLDMVQHNNSNSSPLVGVAQSGLHGGASPAILARLEKLELAVSNQSKQQHRMMKAGGVGDSAISGGGGIQYPMDAASRTRAVNDATLDIFMQQTRDFMEEIRGEVMNSRRILADETRKDLWDCLSAVARGLRDPAALSGATTEVQVFADAISQRVHSTTSQELSLQQQRTPLSKDFAENSSRMSLKFERDVNELAMHMSVFQKALQDTDRKYNERMKVIEEAMTQMDDAVQQAEIGIQNVSANKDNKAELLEEIQARLNRLDDYCRRRIEEERSLRVESERRIDKRVEIIQKYTNEERQWREEIVQIRKENAKMLTEFQRHEAERGRIREDSSQLTAAINKLQQDGNAFETKVQSELRQEFARMDQMSRQTLQRVEQSLSAERHHIELKVSNELQRVQQKHTEELARHTQRNAEQISAFQTSHAEDVAALRNEVDIAVKQIHEDTKTWLEDFSRNVDERAVRFNSKIEDETARSAMHITDTVKRLTITQSDDVKKLNQKLADESKRLQSILEEGFRRVSSAQQDDLQRVQQYVDNEIIRSLSSMETRQQRTQSTFEENYGALAQQLQDAETKIQSLLEDRQSKILQDAKAMTGEVTKLREDVFHVKLATVKCQEQVQNMQMEIRREDIHTIVGNLSSRMDQVSLGIQDTAKTATREIQGARLELLEEIATIKDTSSQTAQDLRVLSKKFEEGGKIKAEIEQAKNIFLDTSYGQSQDLVDQLRAELVDEIQAEFHRVNTNLQDLTTQKDVLSDTTHRRLEAIEGDMLKIRPVVTMALEGTLARRFQDITDELARLTRDVDTTRLTLSKNLEQSNAHLTSRIKVLEGFKGGDTRALESLAPMLPTSGTNILPSGLAAPSSGGGGGPLDYLTPQQPPSGHRGSLSLNDFTFSDSGLKKVDSQSNMGMRPTGIQTSQPQQGGGVTLSPGSDDPLAGVFSDPGSP